MGQLTLVLGGVRSGKSRFAEQLAAAYPPVVYLATAQALDAEMARRIAFHQERRPPQWRTVEEPWHVPGVLADLARPAPGQVDAGGSILVECVTLWLANLLQKHDDRMQAAAVGCAVDPGRLDRQDQAGDSLADRSQREGTEVLDQVQGLIESARLGAGRVIVVSNEVGSGIVPANDLARRFSDLLGEANQRLAAAAHEVYLCVAGIPLRLKREAFP